MYEKFIEQFNSYNQNIKIYEDGYTKIDDPETRPLIQGIFRHTSVNIIPTLETASSLLTVGNFTIKLAIPPSVNNLTNEEILKDSQINEYKGIISDIIGAMAGESIEDTDNSVWLCPTFNNVGVEGGFQIINEGKCLIYSISGSMLTTASPYFAKNITLKLGTNELEGIVSCQINLENELENTTPTATLPVIRKVQHTSDSITVACWVTNTTACKAILGRYNADVLKATKIAVDFKWQNVSTTSTPDYLINRAGNYLLTSFAFIFSAGAKALINFTLVRCE